MTDDPPVLEFEEHREEAASDNRVRCPKCNKRIYMHETRCPYCVIHFEGEAWEFSPLTLQSAKAGAFGLPNWLIAVVAALVLVGLLLSIF